MKSFKKFLAIPAFTIIALGACQDEFKIEDNVNPPGNPIPGAGDSIYLSQIYVLADLGSGLDTASILTLNFDASKRVISMIDSSVFSQNNYILTYKYLYNGVDSVPARAISSRYYPDLPNEYDSAYIFLRYNIAGKKVTDSVVYRQSNGVEVFPGLDLTRYSYAGNEMYSDNVLEYFGTSPFTSSYRDTTTLNAAGDIMSNRHYRLDGSEYVLLEKMNLVYDDKISPFKYLSSYMVHSGAPYSVLELYTHLSKANILEKNAVVQNPPNGGTYNWKWTYQYNSLNLPVSASMVQNQGLPDEATLQILYRYVKL